MDKRGPKRVVTEAVRVGQYGATSWHIELECGHAVTSNRKPKVRESRLCCKACGSPQLPARFEVFDDDGFSEFSDPMSDLKIRAAVASKVGVPLDQVDLRGGTATVFIDAVQLRGILASS